MNDLSIIKSDIFEEVLQKGINKLPLGKRYIGIHVSSHHMNVFYEYYDKLSDLEHAKGYELIDPGGYSRIIIVWDCDGNQLLYYDIMNISYMAFDYYENHKDDPDIKPKVEIVQEVKPMTEQSLMEIATKSAKNV